MRQWRGKLAKAAEALAVVIQLRIGKTGPVVKSRRCFRCFFAGIAHDEAAGEKLSLRHV